MYSIEKKIYPNTFQAMFQKKIVNFTHIKLDIVVILGEISVEQI